MSSIISKADLRNTVAIVVIASVVGPFWIIFLQTPISPSLTISDTVFMMLLTLMTGTVIGIFTWLGFKQGQISGQQNNG
jgi:hypothetical protein